MPTAWNHLPNAGHIDRIIADLRVNPNNWVQAWDRVKAEAWNDARSAALVAARDAAWVAAWTATWAAARKAATVAAKNRAGAFSTAAYTAASYAILALFAWDETRDYLNLSINKVRVLAALGDHKAVLMLPAVIAFERSKETT